MADLDCIPNVENCCFCIELKIGSILIAISGLFDSMDITTALMLPICPSGKSGSVEVLQIFIAVLCISGNLAILVTSIAFIIGIVQGTPSTATWFMYAILFSLLTRLVVVIATIVTGIMFSDCSIDWRVYHQTILFFLWLHYIAVVKSYREMM